MNSTIVSENVVTLCRAGVNLSGLMSVLSKHLYSTPLVALRELVQNAQDSIVRRRFEEQNWQGPSCIKVIGNPQAKTIHIIDNGAGLTEREIHDYLATVGIGYTRTLREKHDENNLIGMFGLGFLSAFVLAKRVTFTTTSYQTPDQSFCYVSENAEHYSVSPVAARETGAEIRLELNDPFISLASPARLREVLNRYCILLPEPIYVIGDNQDENPVNPAPPPWRAQTGAVPHPVQARKKNLEFATRFEHNFEPICTVPVHATESSDALGLLWVQDGGTYGTSDNRNLSVFLHGMLLDDKARDLLPPWAGFIGGVIESNTLTPTASREDLQRDQQYKAVQCALCEALIDGLADVARSQPEAWRRILLRHNEALLGASLCDDRLFDLMMDSLKIPTSQGDLPVRNIQSKGAAHVILESDNGFEEMLFRALGVPVAYGYRYAVVPFLRRWTQARGIRLIELGTEQGNRQLFSPKALSDDEMDWLEQSLADSEKLVTAHFNPIELPLVVVPDRDAELKRRLEDDTADKRISIAALNLVRQFTARIETSHTARLYVNLGNPAIDALLEAHRRQLDCGPAVRLLKAFKCILVSQGNSQIAGERLKPALEDLAAAVRHLLPKA